MVQKLLPKIVKYLFRGLKLRSKGSNCQINSKRLANIKAVTELIVKNPEEVYKKFWNMTYIISEIVSNVYHSALYLNVQVVQGVG